MVPEISSRTDRHTQTYSSQYFATAPADELITDGRHLDKNSSNDEIENVYLFTTISHTYIKVPKKHTSFSKLNDS